MRQPLLRRLRRVRNRFDLRLAEHPGERVGHDVVDVIGRHAEHLGVQAKSRIEVSSGIWGCAARAARP